MKKKKDRCILTLRTFKHANLHTAHITSLSKTVHSDHGVSSSCVKLLLIVTWLALTVSTDDKHRQKPNKDLVSHSGRKASYAAFVWRVCLGDCRRISGQLFSLSLSLSMLLFISSETRCLVLTVTLIHTESR